MISCKSTKNCLILRRKIVFEKTAATQLSVIGKMMSSAFSGLSDIGQLTSSCIISDLGGKEQPIKIHYFNIGNNKLYSLQFGFRKKHSTFNKLISMTEKIRNTIDNRNYGRSVFIDLKKVLILLTTSY